MNRRKLIRQAAVAHLIDKTAAEERVIGAQQVLPPSFHATASEFDLATHPIYIAYEAAEFC